MERRPTDHRAIDFASHDTPRRAQCRHRSRWSRTCTPPTPAPTCSRVASTSIPSHDIDAGVPENDDGGHFDMRDYHVLSMDDVGGDVTDHGVALSIEDMCRGRDASSGRTTRRRRTGRYYMYFPAKDQQRRLPHRRRDQQVAGRTVHSRSPSRSRAASASIRAYSVTTTERTTSTSAVCGAGSSSAGGRARTTRQRRAIRPTTVRRSARAWPSCATT